jgi:radical SAM-linked protein
VAADRVMAMLNAALPAGIRVLEAREIPLRATSLSVIIAAVRYRVTLGEKAGDLAASAERFLGLESFPWRREKEGKSTEIDLRRELVELSAGEDFLTMLVRRGKPVEFAAAITGLSPAELAGARIEKLEVLFSE